MKFFEGPKLKRIRPRAQGRAFKILNRLATLQ
jgi:ribosomal protein L22